MFSLNKNDQGQAKITWHIGAVIPLANFQKANIRDIAEWTQGQSHQKLVLSSLRAQVDRTLRDELTALQSRVDALVMENTQLRLELQAYKKRLPDGPYE